MSLITSARDVGTFDRSLNNSIQGFPRREDLSRSRELVPSRCLQIFHVFAQMYDVKFHSAELSLTQTNSLLGTVESFEIEQSNVFRENNFTLWSIETFTRRKATLNFRGTLTSDGTVASSEFPLVLSPPREQWKKV